MCLCGCDPRQRLEYVRWGQREEIDSYANTTVMPLGGHEASSLFKFSPNCTALVSTKEIFAGFPMFVAFRIREENDRAGIFRS